MISSLLCRIAVAITITLAILTPISNASSALYVEQPEALIRIINQIDPPAPGQPGELKEATAAYFGSSFYQSLLSGNLVLASQGRMDDGTPADYGCGNTAGALFDPMSNPIWKALIDGGQPSVVLLVKRGSNNTVSCPFDRKVLNAQQSVGGVIAVLIYDVTETNRIRMVDRGLGSQIKIPSFFLNIHYRDRVEESKNVLEKYMENKAPKDAYVAEMSLEFYLPNDDGRVEMEYWYNVADDEAVPFLTSFGAPARKLGDQMLIEPRQFFSNGAARCPSEYCSKNCRRIPESTTGEIKYYCSPSTTAPSSIFGTVEGAAIVDEAIKQMCLYDLFTEGDWRDSIWMWTYWELFYSFVGPDPLQSSDWTDRKQARAKGIFTVMHMRGMPSRYQYDDVLACYAEIVTEGNVTRMNNRVKEWESKGPVGRLSVYINDSEYYGTPRCPVPITHATCGILSGICYGYANNTVPDACLKNQNCPFGEDTCGGSTNIDNSVLGVSAGAVVGIVIAFLIVTGVIVWLYLRHYKQRMRADVDVLLQQYLPMDPGATHGSRNLSKVREAQEKRLISDIDLEDQALETRGL